MKSNGYRAVHRNRWLLLREEVLNLREFILLEFLIDNMDFDPNHGEKYGTYEFFPEEITIIFNKTSETINEWHKGLLKKGIVGVHDLKRGLYKIAKPERYLTNANFKGNAHKYAKEETNCQLEKLLQNICLFPEVIGKKLFGSEIILKIRKKSLDKRTSKAISSSKVQSNVYPKKIVINQEDRSDQEYKELQEKYEISTEDMKWIDADVKEVF